VWSPGRIGLLFALVVVVLFLPKLLALALALRLGQVAAFGGARSLLRGVLLESLASALFAPIRMAFYCRFVVANLFGHAVGWAGGDDDDHEETTWSEAWRRHGWDTAIACTWLLGLYGLHPAAFWWLAPLAGALVFSIPLSVLASRPQLGERARAAGWCVAPEELQPPRELRELEEELRAVDAAAADRWRGFAGAVVDPKRNALHRALLREPRSLAPRIRATRHRLALRALEVGPDALAPAEKHALLADAPALEELHTRVWRLERGAAARRWGLDADAAPAGACV
jgi:membrane glycosyltransferase